MVYYCKKYYSMKLADRVFSVTKRIPKGKVLTYGLVAKLAGVKSPRVVGNILHKNIDPEKIPCHRVVNAAGKVAAGFAFGGARGQMEKLQKEGVVVTHGKVDLTKYLWITGR